MRADNDKTHSRRIARRLILAMVLFSSLITLVVTAIQLYRDYHRDLLLIDSQLKQIEDVHLRSIAGSLWLLDEKGMQVQVDGILELPDIYYIEVNDGDRIWAAGGKKQTDNMILQEYPLTFEHLGREQVIGSMTAVASLQRIYQRLIDKTVDILVSNAIRTFLVAGFILLVFYLLVTRHLVDIAGFLRSHKGSLSPPPRGAVSRWSGHGADTASGDSRGHGPSGPAPPAPAAEREEAASVQATARWLERQWEMLAMPPVSSRATI